MSYQREFEQRLNVAVVGVGSHGYRNILPALHYLPVRLTGSAIGTWSWLGAPPTSTAYRAATATLPRCIATRSSMPCS